MHLNKIETAHNRQATLTGGALRLMIVLLFHIVSVRNAYLFFFKDSPFLMRKWAKQEKKEKLVVKLLILGLAVVIISNVIICAVIDS
ncbi:MAG: hypothetical protein WBC05_04420 [Sedimentisphaerales bacterium]